MWYLMWVWKEQRRGFVSVAADTGSSPLGGVFFVVKVAQRHLRGSLLVLLRNQALK